MSSHDFTAALILSTSHAIRTAHALRSHGANERDSDIHTVPSEAQGTPQKGRKRV